MTLHDYFTSLIRTAVPTVIASGVTWLATRYNIILDENTSAQLGITVTGLVLLLYYGAVRTLETRWPMFGLLLGSKKQPEYTNRTSNEIQSRREE